MFHIDIAYAQAAFPSEHYLRVGMTQSTHMYESTNKNIDMSDDSHVYITYNGFDHRRTQRKYSMMIIVTVEDLSQRQGVEIPGTALVGSRRRDF